MVNCSMVTDAKHQETLTSYVVNLLGHYLRVIKKQSREKPVGCVGIEPTTR